MPADHQHQPSQPPQPLSHVEPRKKRTKIVSACGECRRKKTKCNGEQPCHNCQKSGVACLYPAASHPVQDDHQESPNKVTLDAIEDRLTSIESMLKFILASHNGPPDGHRHPMETYRHHNTLSMSTPTHSSAHRSPPHPPHRPAHSHRAPLMKASTSSSPPYRRSASPPYYSAREDLRLPSIHSRSLHSPLYRASDSSPGRDRPLLDPLQTYHLHSPRSPTAGSCRPYQSETEDDMLKPRK